jgi:hypothetical protein
MITLGPKLINVIRIHTIQTVKPNERRTSGTDLNKN